MFARDPLVIQCARCRRLVTNSYYGQRFHASRFHGLDVPAANRVRLFVRFKRIREVAA